MDWTRTLLMSREGRIGTWCMGSGNLRVRLLSMIDVGLARFRY